MITAVVHTYNEEKNIARCLSSLFWVDEIVLVDMGSTDDTLKIVSEYKVKVFNHPFTGFVEPARNFAQKKAQGDWIMIVDADEEIPRTLAGFLLKFASEGKYDYLRIPRKNYIFDRWIKNSGWWPDYQIRFFKKNSVRWTDKIHSVPLTRGEGHDLELREELSIVHHNYQSIAQFLERLNRYSDIRAKELFVANGKFRYEYLFEKPVKEFVRRFIVWGGYKDGLHGLALSLLQAFSELAIYLKLWELYDFFPARLSLKDVFLSIRKEYKMITFHFSQELIGKTKNNLLSLLMRVKRKLGYYG